jgi:hypothetical protein
MAVRIQFWIGDPAARVPLRWRALACAEGFVRRVVDCGLFFGRAALLRANSRWCSAAIPVCGFAGHSRPVNENRERNRPGCRFRRRAENIPMNCIVRPGSGATPEPAGETRAFP